MIPWYYTPVIFLGVLLLVLVILVLVYKLAQRYLDGGDDDGELEADEQNEEERKIGLLYRGSSKRSFSKSIRSKSSNTKEEQYSLLNHEDKIGEGLSSATDGVAREDEKGAEIMFIGESDNLVLYSDSDAEILESKIVSVDEIEANSQREISTAKELSKIETRAETVASSSSEYNEAGVDIMNLEDQMEAISTTDIEFEASEDKIITIDIGVRYVEVNTYLSGILTNIVGVPPKENGGPGRIRFHLSFMSPKANRRYKTMYSTTSNMMKNIPWGFVNLTLEEALDSYIRFRLYGRREKLGVLAGKEVCYGETYLHLKDIPLQAEGVIISGARLKTFTRSSFAKRGRP